MMLVLLTIMSIGALLLAVSYQPPPLYAAAQHRSDAVCDTVSEIPLVACQSLVALYTSTAGPNWRNNTNWLLTATPCTWYGVTCNGGRITMLDLHGNRLTGALPPQLGDLTALHTLQLQNNQLSGPLPPQLGNLTQLTDLRLFNNQLTGAIPAELGNLRDLEQLWLAVNQFTGPLPATVGNLTNLVTLRLEYNGLDGPIPLALASLINLQTDPYGGLDLGYNKLMATDPTLVAFLNAKDPDWAQSQTVPPTDIAVTVQSIGSVQLTWHAIAYQGDGGAYAISVATTPGGPYTLHGTTADKTATSYVVGPLEPGATYYFVVNTRTPAHGSQQTALESPPTLEVTATTPAIPTDFCAGVVEIPGDECRALQLLFTSTAGTAWQASTGWMTTPTPCAWHGVRCRDDTVVELDLAANHLVGTLPAALGNLTHLEGLYLERNQLTGSIPPELGNLTQLVELYLAENALSGALPAALGQLSGLQVLDLDSNQFSGAIPPQLGNLTALEGLWLDGNQLDGAIPAELGNLTQLQTLWLFNNQLHAALPAALGALTNLRDLRLHANQLSGAIPPELGNLINLKRLYLHSNQLSGAIPATLGNLTDLERLYLYENQLSGPLPPTLGNLPNLEWLQLQENQLTGALPAELGKLANLTWLNLSANQLSGALPPELGNLNNLIGLDLHANQLSGPIPPALGNLRTLTELTLHENRLMGAIPDTLGALSNLGSLNLARNALSGPIPATLANLTQLNSTTAGATDLGYNALSGADDPLRAFLATKDPDWAETQTAPPVGLQARAVDETNFDLTWSPVAFTVGGGYYEIGVATTPDGPYTMHGVTADKATTSYRVANLLPDATYYFVVRTYTPPHDLQQNELWSSYSAAAANQALIYLPLVSR